jgi:hypothetical protein
LLSESGPSGRPQKNATRSVSPIVFVDESGFLLISTVRWTWSPIGLAPILRHRYCHDRISAVSGIAVRRRWSHCTLCGQPFEDSIHGAEAALIPRHLLHQIPGPLFVVWDNGQIRRGDPIEGLFLRTRRLLLVLFPSCAPELNADEGVWNLLKNRLANGLPDTSAGLVDRNSEMFSRLGIYGDDGIDTP